MVTLMWKPRAVTTVITIKIVKGTIDMANASGNNAQLLKSVEKKSLTDAQQKEVAFQNLITKGLSDSFKAIQSVIPKHITPERLCRVGLQAVSRTPKLLECAPETIVGAIMNCAAMGLEPNLIGHAYLVPFWNGKKRRMECQFQIGYRGYIELFRRTGVVQRISAHEVYANDVFSYELGVNDTLKHVPLLHGDRGNVIGYYAVYHLKDSGYGFHFMSFEQVLTHAKRFSASKNKAGELVGPWVDNFDEMAKKTCIRLMSKYMPISIENQTLAEGIMSDERVVEVKKDQTGLTGEAFFDSTYATSQTIDMETGEILSKDGSKQEADQPKDAPVPNEEPKAIEEANTIDEEIPFGPREGESRLEYDHRMRSRI